MSRRLVLLATLMMLGLSGCVTMSDGYDRVSYYSDGGYYYPAEDGYGDYYQGREDVNYRYYESSAYSPFWRLDRYACGPYYGCSPYWNSYYGRPSSGWGISFGSQWNYGSWGWYGRDWSPWYDSRSYWRHPRRPHNDDRLPPGVLRPGEGAPGQSGSARPPRQDYTGRPRPGLREPGVIDDNGGPGSMPRPLPRDNGGDRPGPGGDQGRPGYGPGAIVPRDDNDGRVRPLPRPDFRDRYDGKQPVRDAEPGLPPGVRPGMTPRPVERDRDAPYRPEPRYERPEPREQPRYERPEPREQPRYERPEPREQPRYERPEPREQPRAERAAPREVREVRSSSQNETAGDER